ncbi:hypothetical protein OIU34_17035 [Pararhizobium sp. BT-229]|uniref:hypothetical protein n=1 Tax=Pararhizobium sp. BT-229 TaxID=2986923 RepID=UPI0021F7F6AE|nr:hypothetical protein [Pararhizobium sp. BT-229]MCV9963606.1 hypothetical protein [Pararhizobium sp. BT-229]
MPHHGRTKSPRGVDPLYPRTKYFDPSRYWGEKLGLPALFNCYDQVFRGRHVEIELSVRHGRDRPEIDRIHDELVAAYPEIAALGAADFDEKYAVVTGCTSKLAQADIRHYLDNYLRSGNETAGEEESVRKARVQHSLGFALEWRISPEILGVLENHLALPYWATDSEEFKVALRGIAPTGRILDTDHDVFDFAIDTDDELTLLPET